MLLQSGQFRLDVSLFRHPPLNLPHSGIHGSVQDPHRSHLSKCAVALSFGSLSLDNTVKLQAVYQYKGTDIVSEPEP